MAYNDAFEAYQRTNVSTSSQGHLIVLLYEACVKNLKNASTLINDGGNINPDKIEAFGSYIQKAQAIITELQVSLNMEAGQEIAKNLMALYVYFNSELTQASINHDRNKIEFVYDKLQELLGSWKQAAESYANNAQRPVTSAINIVS